MLTIAFRPDDPDVEADVRIADLLELVDLAGLGEEEARSG